MKAKQLTIYAIILTVGMCFLSLSANAADTAKTISSRMKARLPEIVSLKQSRIIGENNKGYLVYLGKDKQKEDIVNAENADRKTIYNIIAKQQGTTVDYVGKQRAKQIAQRAEKGYQLPKGNGDWYQK